MTGIVRGLEVEPASKQIKGRRGARACANRGVLWQVWAPLQSRLDLIVVEEGREHRVRMNAEASGYFACELTGIREGQEYWFELGGQRRADPCSLFQPHGVDGPSAVFFPERFGWTDAGWRGVSRQALAIYELHIGTFTSEGTFDSAIAALPALKDLGIMAIEIMPVGQFPGTHDGVLPYAAQHSYGGPRALQRFVDAAHAIGLGVILDVVYNHFGPEGSYLREFGPYFTDKYKTPWGDAVNYDDRGSDGVRSFILDNARMWLEEFHLDGLRLDAVHAIYDLGPRHILREIQEVAREVSQATGREIHVIGESDLNDPRVVSDPRAGGYGLDAQWSHDFHHAVHALLTGERNGYYVDYGSPAQVATVLNTPFILAGEYSKHRGRRHGAPADGIPPNRFVVCIQNHDQIGNRALGDRLPAILSSDPFGASKRRLTACLLLLSPYVPLLFMGEEYDETNPFPFFCSFQNKELTEEVRQGRQREFSDFVSDPTAIPDPTAKSTFGAAKLQWGWAARPSSAQTRDLYRQLLRARQSCPALAASTDGGANLLISEIRDQNVVRYSRGSGKDGLLIYFNLGGEQPRRR